MDLGLLTIESVRAAVAQRAVTATVLAEDFYRKIEADDPAIHAYLLLSRERALAQAARIDALAEKGDPLPPLAGVPIAIKDVLLTRGVGTSAGSKILEHYIPPYDSTAVARLEAAGAV